MANFIDLHFPHAGLDVSQAFDRQPNRPTQTGDYARTTLVATNVRAYEPGTDRMRGGSRPGLAKWCPTQLNSGASIQDISVITLPNTADSALMKSTRTVKVAVVSGGKLYDCTRTTATLIDGSFLSASAKVVFAAPSGLKLWYTDGASLKYYDPVAGTTGAWTASAGSLPSGGGEVPRLVEHWQGRVGLTGLRSDPQNTFFSAVDNARDYDYSPTSTTPTQAVAGNNSPYGTVGDEITALVPFGDDAIVFGGDHTLWVAEGDLMQGGKIVQQSDSVGMAFGRPYCQSPEGVLYFFGQRGGVYQYTLDSRPQPFSSAIWALLKDVQVADYSVRMIWDDRAYGFHLTLTPYDATVATTHYFYEARTGAWFSVVFANKNHNPKCLAVYDGDDPDDRAVLLGSNDGYVRFFDPSATKDDGTAIASEVVIGPLLTPNLDEVKLHHMQAVLGDDSGDVTWSVYSGYSAESALANDPVRSGTFKVGLLRRGRSWQAPVGRAGYALYVKLSATTPWALESIRCAVDNLGKVRMRG